MFSVISNQRNANQNCFEMQSHQEWQLLRKQITDAGKNVDKREALYIADGTVNSSRHCGNQYGGSSKNLK